MDKPKRASFLRAAKVMVATGHRDNQYATCMCRPTNQDYQTQMTRSREGKSYAVICYCCGYRSYFALTPELAAALWTLGARIYDDDKAH